MTEPVKRKFSGAAFRNFTLLGFFVAVILLTGYVFSQAGGYFPGFSKVRDYKVSFDVPSVANLATFSDVYTAGVQVGKVASIDRASNDRIRITLALDAPAVPVHQGSTVQLTERLLTGSFVVRLVPGTGPALPTGSVLLPTAVKGTVQLRDVLASLDMPTRDSLGHVIHSLGQGTDGRQKDLSALMAGLADVGGKGYTVLDALVEQSSDLEDVSRELGEVSQAADVGHGQIVQLVSNLNKVTAATVGQRPAVEASIRKIPDVLDHATSASADINRLAAALAPVSADLKRAAPDLNAALDDLPDTSRDLRRAIGPLDAVLDRAPPTLDKLPKFGEKTRNFVPPTISALRDVNPILRYISPYGNEIAAVNRLGSMWGHYGDDGAAYARLKPYAEARSLRPDPVGLPSPLYNSNPYPKPGEYPASKPFTGKYPRVDRDK